MADFGFMLFGFGIFFYSINLLNQDETRQWERRIMEMREFGVPKDPKKRFRRHRRR